MVIFVKRIFNELYFESVILSEFFQIYSYLKPTVLRWLIKNSSLNRDIAFLNSLLLNFPADSAYSVTKYSVSFMFFVILCFGAGMHRFSIKLQIHGFCIPCMSRIARIE